MLARIGVTPVPAVESDERGSWLAWVRAGVGSLMWYRNQIEAVDGLAVRSFMPPMTTTIGLVHVRRPAPAGRARLPGVRQEPAPDGQTRLTRRSVMQRRAADRAVKSHSGTASPARERARRRAPSKNVSTAPTASSDAAISIAVWNPWSNTAGVVYASPVSPAAGGSRPPPAARRPAPPRCSPRWPRPRARVGRASTVAVSGATTADQPEAEHQRGGQHVRDVRRVRADPQHQQHAAGGQRSDRPSSAAAGRSAGPARPSGRQQQHQHRDRQQRGARDQREYPATTCRSTTSRKNSTPTCRRRRRTSPTLTARELPRREDAQRQHRVGRARGLGARRTPRQHATPDGSAATSTAEPFAGRLDQRVRQRRRAPTAAEHGAEHVEAAGARRRRGSRARAGPRPGRPRRRAAR